MIDDRDAFTDEVSSDSADDASVGVARNRPSGSERLPAILLFGMPGAGKGTQGRLLGTMAGLFHISTGEIFRSLDRSTEDGRTVRDLIDHGNLVPDELAVRIWRTWLDTAINDRRLSPDSDVLVLDGIPRSIAQCQMLESQIDVLAVVHLSTKDEEPLVQRLLCPLGQWISTSLLMPCSATAPSSSAARRHRRGDRAKHRADGCGAVAVRSASATLCVSAAG